MAGAHCARNLSSSLYYFVGVPAATILELFGGMFFDFCQESGYGSILQVLGATTRDFLNNLDTLHDHLQVSGKRAYGLVSLDNNLHASTSIHEKQKD